MMNKIPIQATLFNLNKSKREIPQNFRGASQI